MLRCYRAPGNGCLNRQQNELWGKHRYLLQTRCLWRFGCIVVFCPFTMLLCCMNMAWDVNRNLKVKIVLDCRFWKKKLQFFIQARGLYFQLSPLISHLHVCQSWGAPWQLFYHSSMAWKNSRGKKKKYKQERELERYRKYWYEKNWNRTSNIAFTFFQRVSLDHHLLKIMSYNTETVCLWYGDAEEHKERQLSIL